MTPSAAPQRSLCLVALVAGLALAAGHASGAHGRWPPAQGPPGPKTQASAEFLARVNDYIELRRAVERSLPPLPRDSTPEQIDTRQRARARLIEQQRVRSQPGSVFTSAARAHFRTELLRVLSGPDGALLRSSIMDENPGRIALRINARYPDSLPLSTMPIQVLAVLPGLPEELEYRFVGDRLVLLDADAHLIVDYMDNALPK